MRVFISSILIFRKWLNFNLNFLFFYNLFTVEFWSVCLPQIVIESFLFRSTKSTAYQLTPAVLLADIHAQERERDAERNAR